MRKSLKVTLFAAVVGGLLVGGYFFVISVGHDELISIAREHEFCTDEACEEGAILVADTLIDQTAFTTREQIEWCLGTEVLSETRVRKGGLIKSFLIDMMYSRCS